MLGFWIIITHIVGAYLTTSEYVRERAMHSTTFAAIAAVLYMIPFVLFLPGSFLSFAAIIVFRFIVVRFNIIDYVVWAKNLLSPAEYRSELAVKTSVHDVDDASTTQAITIHAGSLAIHCIFMGIAIIII